MNSVAVHDGPFHADEVFAVATLRLIWPKIKVIRTRDPELLKTADMRVDIGKLYNPKSNDFDHHQLDGAGKRLNDMPYAAAGLVWKHFGRRLTDSGNAWGYIDKRIMQPIDAKDNGIKTYETKDLSPYTISEIIKAFNPSWIDGNTGADECFEDAIYFAGEILRREIKTANATVKAKELVKAAIEEANTADRPYIILDMFCPWKKVVVENSDKLFVVYPAMDGSWMVKTVPTTIDGFESRKPFPESWAGLDEKELQKVCGVSDAKFCHRQRFICGAHSKEGAIAMVKIACKD